jgi:hypothetical protein
MRAAHWMLGLGVLMFVTSIWFILAGTRPGTATAAGPATEPVATVRQIMDAIVTPASNTVYESVAIIVTAEGITEHHPRTNAEWDTVSAAAAVLAEAGGQLMAEGRARDTDRWMEISQEMIDASLISMKAALDQDKDALLASGEALNNSCDNCHQLYNVDIPDEF